MTLHIGTQSNGQGHATAYAQFVAGPLGLDYDRIRVVQGDTDALPKGGGTGGSRSIPLGAPSVDRAARKLAEADQVGIAAEELEAGVADIELADGDGARRGTDRAVDFAELAVARRRTRASLVAIGDVCEQGADLSERHACLRGRDRSRHWLDRDRALSRSSTISARP